MWWVISIGCGESEFFLENAASASRHKEAETGTPVVLLPDSSFSFENGLPAPAWLGLARCNEAALDSSPHSYLAQDSVCPAAGLPAFLMRHECLEDKEP